MKLLRFVARGLVGWIFITSGVAVLRKPAPRAEMAAPTLEKIRERAPALPDDDVMLVRLNAALQIAAGALFVLGKAKRLNALALAGSLVPTTLAGHRYWELDDPAKRSQQRTLFKKNAAMLGGLLLAATEPRKRPKSDD
jgi:putative oxidoreductase